MVFYQHPFYSHGKFTSTDITNIYAISETFLVNIINESFMAFHVGLGGFGVTCSPRDLRFAGSNPAEVDGFFQLGVQSLRFQAR